MGATALLLCAPIYRTVFFYIDKGIRYLLLDEKL